MVIESGDPDLPERLGGRALLSLPAVDTGSSGTMLAVVLRNERSEAQQVVYGLEFGSLLTTQSRKLQEVLETAAEVD